MSTMFGLQNGMGRFNVQQNPLPRPANDFVQGNYSPLTPVYSTPIDYPRMGVAAPPRRWVYPPGWNIPIGVPGSEGLKLVSFQYLRYMADVNPLVRACIELRKKEVMGLGWDIVPTGEAAKAIGSDKALHQDFMERRAEMMLWLNNIDPNYASFESWLSAVLEEIFVVDALSLFVQPTAQKGAGPFGSDLQGLTILDGTTIRPMVDLQGGTPNAPDVAYQQYYFGVPRVDLMIADMSNTELPASSLKDYEPGPLYKGTELIYLPFEQRSWTVYGFPPLERCIIAAQAYQEWLKTALDFYSEGSLPGQYVVAPPEYTADQMQELQETLTSYSGDIAWKHKQIVLPNGCTTIQIKPNPVADQATEMLISQVAMGFEVQPMELGISPKVSSSGSSGGAANQMAKSSEEIQNRKALRPFLEMLQNSLFDKIIQGRLGQTDMRLLFNGLETEEDKAQQSATLISLIGAGLETRDEARIEMNMPPFGLPESMEPTVTIATGVVPLAVSVDSAQAQLEATQNASPQNASPQVDANGSPVAPKPGKTKPEEDVEESPMTAAAQDADTGVPKQGNKESRAMADVEKLRQYLRHNKPIDKFRVQK